jgi:hypothetical protein
MVKEKEVKIFPIKKKQKNIKIPVTSLKKLLKKKLNLKPLSNKLIFLNPPPHEIIVNFSEKKSINNLINILNSINLFTIGLNL